MLKEKLVLIAYRIFTLLFLFPLATLLLGIRIFTKKENTQRFTERFGWSASKPSQNARYIWIHAASIGEMKVAVWLIRSLQKKYPKLKFLLTTQTLSSSEVFADLSKKEGIENCTHHFIPYDVAGIADLFVRKWNPVISIFIESEIWPLFLSILNKSKIPALLLNARISEKSIRKWSITSGIAKNVFGKFDEICAATKGDQKRYQRFGKNVKCYGNMKIASPKPTVDLKLYKKFRDFYSGKEKPVLILASTSFDEIEGLIKFIEKIHKQANIIIAPRHIKDGQVILLGLKSKNIKADLRTKSRSLPFCPVYIVDTYNELDFFFSISDIAFVGKSMCKGGGQNMLEPIKMGVPTIVGPNTYNFGGIMKELRAYNAIIEVSSFEHLEQTTLNLLKDDRLRSQITKNIATFNDANSDIMNRYIKLISQYL